MELVVLEGSFVDPAVSHYHLAVATLIVEPSAIEHAAVTPNHFALALTLSLSEVTLVVSLFELNACLEGWQRVLVIHLTISIWTSIFKHPDKGVTILERYAALSAQPTVEYTSTV